MMDFPLEDVETYVGLKKFLYCEIFIETLNQLGITYIIGGLLS